jgi:hypothetical protein
VRQRLHQHVLAHRAKVYDFFAHPESDRKPNFEPDGITNLKSNKSPDYGHVLRRARERRRNRYGLWRARLPSVRDWPKLFVQLRLPWWELQCGIDAVVT